MVSKLNGMNSWDVPVSWEAHPGKSGGLSSGGHDSGPYSSLLLGTAFIASDSPAAVVGERDAYALPFSATQERRATV